jgi:rubrerythrin
MIKHGYKQHDDPNVKVAAQKGICPACGSKTKGNPPVCPNCGSEPFEERPDGKKEEG